MKKIFTFIIAFIALYAIHTNAITLRFLEGDYLKVITTHSSYRVTPPPDLRSAPSSPSET